MSAIPRPPLEALVVQCSRRKVWQTPEAHGARMECARELWAVVKAAENEDAAAAS